VSQNLEQVYRPSYDSMVLAEKIVTEELDTENNPTLKQYYSQLMDQLEIDRVPKEKISSVGSLLVRKEKAKKTGLPVEEVSVGRWWFDVAKEKGCIDPHFSHTLIGAELHRENSSINTDEGKAKIIQLLEKTKELSNELIKKFKDTPQILQTFTQEQFNDFYSQWETILKIDEDAIDEKTKIPGNTVHMLLQCLAVESSLTHGAEIFMRTRIKMMEDGKKFLTPKQATKFQRGEIKDQPPILNPKNRELAIFLRYYGQQCSKCNSFCMKEIIEGMKTKVKCITCNNIEDPTTIAKCRCCQIPLYKENLQHIVKTGKCENCNEETTLPEELVIYASQ